MIRTVLAFFGYVKIPTEAVQISIVQEDFIKLVCKYLKTEETKKVGHKHLELQKTLTQFLRSGALLNNSRKIEN